MPSLTKGRINPEIFCAITRTNFKLAMSFAQISIALLFSGAIGAAGPRYCPSIEDKIHRFGTVTGIRYFSSPKG